MAVPISISQSDGSLLFMKVAPQEIQKNSGQQDYLIGDKFSKIAKKNVELVALFRFSCRSFAPSVPMVSTTV